jgi:hypothetical protein
MSFNNNITPGAPPLRWDRVLEAFTKVNENFDILVATVGAGSGLTPIDFSTLDTNVSPAIDNTYSLGTLGTNRWKSVFLAEYQDNPGDQANGVYIGAAQIRGRASTIELPLNSTVVGVPIKEPFFNSIQVDNSLRIEANTIAAPWGETVNLNSGTAMQLVVSSGADSITFNNTGVTSLTGTVGQIAVSTATGNITLTNLGVLSLTSTTALPSGRTEGAGINVNASTGSGIKVTNTGVLSIVAGSAALTVSTDAATGVVTITNAAPAGNTFGSIIVAGDTSFPIVANSPGANFKVNSGEGITLTKDTTTDTLTITVNPVFDLRGSVFGDDSSVIVNAIDRVVTAAGGFIGDLKGSVFGDDSTVIVNAIDRVVTAAGGFIGNVTGTLTGNADTATTANRAIALDITNTNGLTTVYYPTFVEDRTISQTVRADVDLSYRTDTNTLTVPNIAGNLTGSVTGNIFTSLIDSSDSSAITVTPIMIFSSDVVVENELSVAERLTVKGSRVINLTELQAITAASTNFADFQTRIAALA